MSGAGHERELGSHQLPDNLVGIGGVGKAVVDRFLSEEWIVEEAVGATRYGGGLRGYILDTATDERAADESHVAEHNDRIRRIAEESDLDLDLELPGTDVHVEYMNPVEDVPDALLSDAGAAAGDIAGDAEPPSWWLRDDEVSTDRGYEVGTVRRRADGKALLQASQRGDGELSDLPERMADGTTTIVAGVAGGTGSGMATELAKQIRAAGGRVTLVGILPPVDAHDRVRANTFATLSELEYLAVTDRNPFRNIVLLPHGPASDLDYQDTFLDGVVKTIVARENLAKSGRRFDESNTGPIPKRFAPFTLATPQTLRYNVEDVRRAERSIREYCDAKRAALDVELELYRALEECFRQEWGGDVAEALDGVGDDRFTLRDHDAKALRTRLDDLQSWLDDGNTFGHVHSQVLADWRDQIGGWIGETDADLSEDDAKRRLVTRLPDRVDWLDPVDEIYPSEPDDQLLASVIRDELRTIGRRAELLRLRNLLESEDPEAGAALAATVEPEGAFTAMQRLDPLVDEAEHRLHRHRTNRETLDELESVMIEERDELETLWCNAVMDDIEALVALETNAEAVRSRLETVENEVERSLRTIEAANTPEELPPGPQSVDFEELNHRLQAVGIDPVDVDAIERSIEHAAAAFEAWYEYNRETPLDLLPIGDRKADAREEYLAHVGDVDGRFVDIKPAGDDALEVLFACESLVEDQFDEIRAELDEKRAYHRARLGDELEQVVSAADLSDVVDPYRDRWDGDDFDVELPARPDNASDRIEKAVGEEFDAESTEAALDGLLAADSDREATGIVRTILDEALVEPIRRRRERLETDASDVEARLERYDRLREVVTELGVEFDGSGPARPEVSDPSPIDLDSDDPYVTEITSDDQHSLLQYHDIADSGVWTEPTMESEKRKIEQYFRERFADDAVRNTELNRLANRVIEIRATNEEYLDAIKTRYDGHNLTNVFLSRAFPHDLGPEGTVFDGVREVFEMSELHFGDQNYYFRHRHYDNQSVGFGAPWDLSLVTFIGGVFLDNIAGIRWYKEAYDEERTESGNGIRVRHAHGLDGADPRIGDGNDRGYVYRDSLLDLDDPDDLYTLLDSTEAEMVETLLEQYIERVTLPDSSDLD